MSFKLLIDKDEIPTLIKMFNTKYSNTFYDILGEEKFEGIEKISVIVNSGREDELYEDLFDNFGEIAITELITNTNKNMEL